VEEMLKDLKEEVSWLLSVNLMQLGSKMAYALCPVEKRLMTIQRGILE